MDQGNRLSLSRISKPSLYYIVIYIALILFYIADALNKIIYVYNGSDGISSLVRAVFEFIFIFLIFFSLKKSNYYFILFIALLFISFFIGQFFFHNGIPSYTILYGNFKIFNKYIFIFLLYPPVNFLATNSPSLFNRIVNVFYFILLFNSILIIVGFLFDFTLLRSYPFKTYRFGFSGLIPKINEATLFCLISLSFVYYRRYLLKIKNKKDYIIMFAPILLGAKGIYFFILLLLLYHIFSQRNKIINILVISLPLIASVAYFINAPEKLHYFIKQSQENGLLSMLLSGRDNILSEYIGELLNEWNVVNFLFGGQDQTYRMFEMDFFDLFFFLGIFGSTIYLSLMFSTVFNLNIKIGFNMFFILSYFILAFLGGHFFASAINALYLCVLTIYIRVNQNVK